MYLLPHALGTMALYAYAYRDYVRELAYEDSVVHLGAAAQSEALWSSLKHEHAFPLQREGVRAAYSRILPQVIFIDWFVAPLLACAWGWVPLVLPPLADMWQSSNPLLSIALMLLRIAVVAAFYELALVGVHWFMHRPAVYPYTHKLHHMGPQCALAGTYMTAIECTLNGAGLSFLTVGLLGLPMPLVMLTAVAGRMNLGRVHSGWRAIDKDGPPEAAFHGVHHLQMGSSNVNYGFAEWFDRAIGSWVDPRGVFKRSYEPDVPVEAVAAVTSDNSRKKAKKAA